MILSAFVNSFWKNFSKSLERFQINDQMKIFDVDIEYLSNERIKNQTFSDSKHNSKVTIGISGGLDSALALLVCYEAFTKLDMTLKFTISLMKMFRLVNVLKSLWMLPIR